jgi:hypothetical protein
VTTDEIATAIARCAGCLLRLGKGSIAERSESRGAVPYDGSAQPLHLSRFRPLALFGRLPSARADSRRAGVRKPLQIQTHAAQHVRTRAAFNAALLKDANGIKQG